MPEFERRQIGNLPADELESPYNSLVKEWEDQGISYEVTRPTPSESYSSERLAAMGLVGITLVIPKSDQ